MRLWLFTASLDIDFLIELIRTNSGKERDLVRDRLVELFEIAGSTHPDVVSARTSLANALF
jgi:putative thioredoxin